MRRLTVVLVLLGVAALAVLAAGGSAKPPPPLGVSFVVAETFGQGGPFQASGIAVDAGLICPAGTSADVGEKAAPNNGQTGAGVNFTSFKTFACADNSGTFDLKLQVRLNKSGDNFTWVVTGGTGAYATLRGSGQGYGIDQTDTGVTDLYFGTVHL